MKISLETPRIEPGTRGGQGIICAALLDCETHHSEVIIPLVLSVSGAPLLTDSDNMNVSVVMKVAATPNLKIDIVTSCARKDLLKRKGGQVLITRESRLHRKSCIPLVGIPNLSIY